VACRGYALTRRQSSTEDLAEQRTVDLLMQSSDPIKLHNASDSVTTGSEPQSSDSRNREWP